jgi:PKD repeat protein
LFFEKALSYKLCSGVVKMKTLKRLNPWFLFLLFLSVSPAWGQPANFTLDFETGNLRGWQKTGNAFDHQPTLNDNPTARHRGQLSGHQGRYWIGTYEKYQGFARQKPGQIQGDGPTGRLTSAPFTISHDYLKFLIGGGDGHGTRVELLVLDPIEQTYVPRKWASGKNTETMHRVVWNISQFKGKRAKLRIVDDSSGNWGHINADDFRFEVKTPAPNPPAIKYRLKLQVQPGPVAEKEPVTLTAVLDPPRPETGYKFDFGDGKVSDWMPGNSVRHPYRLAGQYTATVYARPGNDQMLQSNKVLVKVVPRSYQFQIRADRTGVTTGEVLTFFGRLLPETPGVRYKCFFGDGQKSPLLDQPRVRHRFEHEGQFLAFCEAYVGNRAVKSNRIQISVHRENYEINLKAEPARVFTGRKVDFTASVSPVHPEMEYLFIFGDNQEKKTDYPPQAEHVYSDPGTYYAQLRARLNGQQVAASSKVQVTVEIQQPTPRAEVFPRQISAQRGEVVRFKGTALPESAEDLEMKWSGPRGQGETGQYFDVETSSLDPGTYKVTLRVTDRFGRSAGAQARLKVLPVTRRISLKVNPEKVQHGQSVELEASIEPEVSGADYNFHFGDDRSSGWLSIAGTSHRYAHPGRYCSYVEAGLPGGKTVKSEQTCLEVKAKRVPKIVIKAEPTHAKPGQEVLLRARLEPSMSGVQYKFIFGDKQTRDWEKEEAASHSYAREGTYRVKALARGEDIGNIESRELLLKVERSNLLFWIIGILFAGSYGFYRIWKGSKNDKKGGEKLAVVKIRANRDPGVQAVVCSNELKGGTEIRICLVKDQGSQEISGEIPLTRDEKGEI